MATQNELCIFKRYNDRSGLVSARREGMMVAREIAFLIERCISWTILTLTDSVCNNLPSCEYLFYRFCVRACCHGKKVICNVCISKQIEGCIFDAGIIPDFF